MRATLLLAVFLLAGCSTPPRPTPMPGPATYVGSARCAACHQKEAEAWEESQHALAIQPATGETVLGDFGDATFEGARFFKRDGKFFVHTEGQEYTVRYVFGVDPLQQLLLELPGGRLQALGIAWDTVEKRWFNLYPGLLPHDPLHWTGRDQNWNHQCADCHSTNLQKNYRPEQDRYETSFSDLSVSCEACHGPGSHHPAQPMGLDLRPPPGRFQDQDPATGSPRHADPAYTRRQTELCAHCHSRRHQLADDWVPGEPLMQAFVPSLLEEDLYYADGQQRGEVYNYGSFLQSKMYRAGVACSDCHDPHTTRLRLEGNALCVSCHQADRFDVVEHTHHPMGTPGASCVNCHAPTTTYMEIDPRHDHSFRVPRPDLSVELGTPNACTMCHADRDARWAARAASRWYPGLERRPTIARALHAGRQGAPGAREKLQRLAEDKSESGIARATALTLLGVSPQSLPALVQALSDSDPLVRLGATRRLADFPAEVKVTALVGMLRDPVRAVRTQAAAALAGEELPESALSAQERAIAEYLQAQLRDSDRPEAHLNRGLLLGSQGRSDEAEAAYRKALALEPTFAPGYVNLADLMRGTGRDSEAEKMLREGLRLCRAEERAELWHALGLLEVRRQRLDAAEKNLREASRLRPQNPRFGLAWALTLEQLGRKPEAVKALRQVEKRHPYDVETLATLVRLLPPDQASGFAERLRKLQN